MQVYKINTDNTLTKLNAAITETPRSYKVVSEGKTLAYMAKDGFMDGCLRQSGLFMTLIDEDLYDVNELYRVYMIKKLSIMFQLNIRLMVYRELDADYCASQMVKLGAGDDMLYEMRQKARSEVLEKQANAYLE